MSRRRFENRIYGHGALATHSVWQQSIGFDPHAPLPSTTSPVSAGVGAERPLVSGYDQFKTLLSRASRHSQVQPMKSTCKRCGGSGHLALNCWNNIQNLSLLQTATGRRTESAGGPSKAQGAPKQEPNDLPRHNSSLHEERKRKRKRKSEKDDDRKEKSSRKHKRSRQGRKKRT